MSSQHDEGYFNPENGDKVAIAGFFNDWSPNSGFLQDIDGDWIYEYEVKESTDTLEFKFIITSETNLDLPNSGWELISNRIISSSVVQEQQPVFEFNLPWRPSSYDEVEFSVSLNNQKILDFFDPEKDHVVVSGTFIDWDPEGIQLWDDDKDGIYEIRMPVQMSSTKPHQYKYRIIKPSDYNGYIPNGGWEQLDDRILIGEDIPRTYFNDQQRIARFVISECWMKDASSNDIEANDLFQIRFYVGEITYLSGELIKTKDSVYETSVAIPMNVGTVRWEVIENQYLALSPIYEDTVTHNGALLELY
ncbi:MAG: hypothetical protein RLN90_00995 [Balneolaceae bacterium]